MSVNAGGTESTEPSPPTEAAAAAALIVAGTLPAPPFGVEAPDNVKTALRELNVKHKYLFKLTSKLEDSASTDVAVYALENQSKLVKRAREEYHEKITTFTYLVNSHDVIADDEVRETYVDSLLDHLSAIETTVTDLESAVEAAVSAAKPTGTKAKSKLQPLSLKNFSGDVTKWPEFRANFRSIIEQRSDLNDIDKVAYLRQACSGEAARVVARFQTGNPNLSAVMRALEERFGRPDLILDETYSAIDNLPAGSYSISDNKKLLDNLISLLTTLETHGVNVNEPSTSSSLLNRVKKKFRGDVWTAWHRRCQERGWLGGAAGGTLPRLDDFLDFAEQELQALAEGEATRRGRRPGGGGESHQNKQKDRDKGRRLPQRATGTALAAGRAPPPSSKSGAKPKQRQGGTSGSGDGGRRAAAKAGAKAPGRSSYQGGSSSSKPETPKPACGFCNTSNHKPDDCPKAKSMTPRDRREALKQGCWRCLSLQHRRIHCPKSPAPCSYPGCDGDHHRLLHGSYDKQ